MKVMKNEIELRLIGSLLSDWCKQRAEKEEQRDRLRAGGECEFLTQERGRCAGLAGIRDPGGGGQRGSGEKYQTERQPACAGGIDVREGVAEDEIPGVAAQLRHDFLKRG